MTPWHKNMIECALPECDVRFLRKVGKRFCCRLHMFRAAKRRANGNGAGSA